jgi:hypothetical protein
MTVHNRVVRSYRLPPGRIVRRARGRYLYDQNSTRYLDIWLADGSAFLGHRPGGYGRLIKEETDRGLWSPFPTQWPARLGRALDDLARVAGCGTGTFLISNGRFSPDLPGGRGRWLPAGPLLHRKRDGGDGETAPSATEIEVVLPAPGVIVPDRTAPEELPAFSAALLTWAARTLVRYLRSDECTRRKEVAWELPVPPGYFREGVWFIPEVLQQELAGNIASGDLSEKEESFRMQKWEQRRASALECGILVPPDPWTPLVVPDDVQSTDRRSWERMCHEWSR